MSTISVSKDEMAALARGLEALGSVLKRNARVRAGSEHEFFCLGGAKGQLEQFLLGQHRASMWVPAKAGRPKKEAVAA